MPEQPLDYIAGQFVEISLRHTHPDSRGDHRWFTLSSSPSEALPAITVNFAHSRSSFKKNLRLLQIGDSVQFGETLGDFVLPLDTSVPLVWIAGGIGITPFRSMAQWMSDSREMRQVRMFHAVRDHNDALFGDVLSSAGVTNVSIFESSKQLLLDGRLIFDSIVSDDTSNILWYISGSEKMVATMRTDLQSHGIGHQQIVTDAFLGYS